MGQIDALTDQGRIITALALIVSARDDLMGLFGGYLTASRRLEDSLNTSAPTDADSARKIAGDVKQALAALTTLGVVAQRIAVSAAGMQPDGTAN